MKNIILSSIFIFYFFQRSGAQENLPVIIMPAKTDTSLPLVFMISGDGGWKTFDKQLSQQFINKNIPVVGLNALKFFWNKKTPEQATQAVSDLIKQYMQQWRKTRFILVGFSFGADVMPFIINRMAPDLSARNSLVALFSPGPTTDFEIHISQMLSGNKKWKYNVADEINRIKSKKVLCFFGDHKSGFPVNDLPKENCYVIYLQGGHEFENNKTDMAKLVLQYY